MMSDKKRKRGRPRVAPLVSYSSEQKMRNHTPRMIKKPRYLQEVDEFKNISRSSTPSRSVDTSSNHSRSSLNGSRSHNSRGYNIGIEDRTTDYHYGSDFEDLSDVEKGKVGMDSQSISCGSSSELDSDFEEYDLGDQNLELDNGGQSSDPQNFVPFWKLGPAGTLGYRPQTPIPVWLQERKFPPLILPNSSDDLLMPQPFILQSIGIYEVLRHFRTIVRLSPFHFEDFCASLIVNEQSVLLTEIHIALIKALIREEDSQQTHFGQLDQKDSTNLSLFFVDSMTWPETLRIYLQSDSDFKQALEIVESCNYPFTSLFNRLKMLQFLCDQFLQTTVAREDLLNEGKIKYDDHCRACHKTGDLLCCDSCPAVFHLDCADPPINPANFDVEDWLCSICIKHNLEGVTDCSSLMEASGLMCRQEPIGYDRHGRKYWFLVRRIIVESESGEVWYYSTVEQLDLLLLLMDGKDLEEALYVALKEFGDDIRRQMELTESITEKAREDKLSALSKESEETRKRIEFIQEEKKTKETVGNDVSVNVKTEPNEEADLKVKSEPEFQPPEDGGSSPKDSVEFKKEEEDEMDEGVKKEGEAHGVESVLNPSGDPDDAIKMEKIWDETAIQRMLSLKLEQLRRCNGHLYRLGCNHTYRNYCNQYTSNHLAVSRQQYNEERDKKRHLTNKFSVFSNTTPEFKWNGTCYGTKENQVSTVRQTILSLEQSVPSFFFHPHWASVRKSWTQCVLNATTPGHFARALLWVVSCVKPSVFCTPWHESLGHLRLKRMTALEREERKKQEKKEKKEADDESRYYPFVKFTKPVKHTLWKVKGEEYRIHGLFGWWWVSSLRHVRHVPMCTVRLSPGPTKITIPIKSQGNVIRGLPVIPTAYHQLAAKNPSMQFSLSSPKQRREGERKEEEGEGTEDGTEEGGIKEVKGSVATNATTTGGSGGGSGDLKGQFEVSTICLEDHFEDGVINVSSELGARLRLVYPKLCRETSVDSLLSRRLALKIQEERDMEKNKAVSEEPKVDKDTPIDVENDSEDTLSETSDSGNIDSIPDSQRRVVINRQRPAGHLLKEMRMQKFKYEALDKLDEFFPCYSPSCRLSGRGACYSPSCIVKERSRQRLVNCVNNYKIITSKPAPFDNVGSKSPVRLSEDSSDACSGDPTLVTGANSDPTKSSHAAGSSATDGSTVLVPDVPKVSTTCESSNEPSSLVKVVPTDEDTTNSELCPTEQLSNSLTSKEDRTFSKENPSGKVYLKRCVDSKKVVKKHRPPPVHMFKVHGSSSSNRSSLFILPSWELRVLARKGGKSFPSGFNPNAKINPYFWPYPCSRPMFKVTFLYRTTLVNTVNAVSHQLRTLWACLRWDDMHEKGPMDGRKQVTTDLEIIQTEILKRKIFGRFLERTEYLRRKVTIPLDVPKPMREFTPSQRSGLRKRRRAQSPVNTQPESVEEWVEEERLELWEIRYFGERLEKATNLSRKALGVGSSGADREGTTFNQVLRRSSSPTDFKSRIEEQIKMQKASLVSQRNIISSNKGVVKVSISSNPTPTGSPDKINFPTKSLIQGGSSSILTVGSKLPNILSGKKIVTTKGGKIITVQTAAGASGAGVTPGGDGVAKIQLGKSSVIPISSLGKLQVGPQGNRIIRLQTVGSGGQRTILPRLGTLDSTGSDIIRPANPNNPSSTTTQGSNNSPGVRPQLQILKLPDGQLQIRGLQEGQQLLQRVDGKLTVVNTKLPTSQTPVQVTQQTKPPIVASSTKDALIKGLTPIATNQIVKINGQQVILRSPAAGGSNPSKQATGMNAKDVLSSLSSAELKTLLDQTQTTPGTPQRAIQVVKTPETTNTTVLTKDQPGAQSLEDKSKTSLPTPPASPSKTAPSSQGASSSTLTLRVQARMTEQGPKTIIQGLQPGVGLTKDHLMAIQQQVHAMVAQYNLQVNQLSPLMTLTLHVTNKTPQGTPPSKVLSGGALTPEKQLVDSFGGNEKAVNETSKMGDFTSLKRAVSPSVEKTQGALSLPDSPKTKGGIRKAAKEDPQGMSLGALEGGVSKGVKRRATEQFDDSFDSNEQRPQEVTKKAKNDHRTTTSRRSDHPTDTPRGAVSPATGSRLLPPPQDPKKRAVKLQKLDGLLTKHKDLLKKDILKKRALLEKELQLQIHRELTIARQQMEKIKSPEGGAGGLHGGANKKSSKQDSSKSSGSNHPATPLSSLPSPKAARKMEPTKMNSSSCGPLSSVASGGRSSPKQPLKMTNKGSKKNSRQRSRKIVCICRTFFDDTKFYVGCDLCGNWFHGDCVGITEALSRSMTEYVCDDCANAKLNKDLFCFCRQPYDETQFYICCDKCEDWYHGKCVGIMQMEADDIDDYICPKCEPDNQWNRPCQKKLTNKDFGEVKKVIKTLIQHKNAWPFLELVDKVEVPDYYKVVKTPMTLKMVESNLYERTYKTLFEFIRDVMLVFDNCRAYNPPNSSFCACANTLELFFCSKLKTLKTKVVQ